MKNAEFEKLPKIGLNNIFSRPRFLATLFHGIAEGTLLKPPKDKGLK